MRSEAVGFGVGVVAGAVVLLVLYKLAKPAVLARVKIALPQAVRQGANAGTNTIINAVGGDRLLAVASSIIVDAIGERLP